MIILRTIDEVSRYVAEQRQRGASIGLVPTMGALHAGHISLVEKCVSENDVTIVSVFVNPTQFNNPADLASYPRKEDDDFRLLSAAGEISSRSFSGSGSDCEQIIPYGHS